MENIFLFLEIEPKPMASFKLRSLNFFATMLKVGLKFAHRPYGLPLLHIGGALMPICHVSNLGLAKNSAMTVALARWYHWLGAPIQYGTIIPIH